MAILFIFSSDAVCWFTYLTPGVCYSLFSIMSLITHLTNKARKNNGLHFIIISTLFIFINGLVYGFDYQNNAAIGYLFAIFGTYLCLSSYDFVYFRKLITDVVFVICLLAVPAYLAFEYGLVHPSSLVAGGGSFMSVGPVIVGWEQPFNRFAGVWHEPGACQIILNIVVLLHLNNIKEWKWEEGRLFQLAFIIFALILTKSTGGYLCFMLIIGAAVSDVKIKGNKRFILIPLLLCLTSVALYLMFYSETIQNKIFVDESESVSKQMRMADILSLWQMSFERPLLGWGLGTKEFYRYSISLGNLTSSSGIIKFAACMGWFWVFVLLIYVWNNVRKLFNLKMSFFVIMAYIVMMNNEDFIEFPISNILLFSFMATKYNNYQIYETNISNNCDI